MYGRQCWGDSGIRPSVNGVRATKAFSHGCQIIDRRSPITMNNLSFSVKWRRGRMEPSMNTHCRFLVSALFSALVIVMAAQLHAESVTYDFNQFGAGGQTTPL